MPEDHSSAADRAIGKRPFSPKNIEAHQVKHNYMLAIAVDGYQDKEIPNLNNCVNDIEGNAKRDGLIQVLTKYYFFNKENIHFLRSRNRYGRQLRKDLSAQELHSLAAKEQEEKGYAFVGEADHRTIIARLKYLAKNITPKDNLIICFSGHGIYDQDFDEGYWIPTDALLEDNASYIENGTIRTALNAISSHHTVLFSDSCYSGTLFSTGQTRSLEVPRVYQHPSRWGLTAGRKEPVSDGALGENSPFAKLLLELLEQRREIWISDLFKEIAEGIEKNDEKQQPVGEALSFIKGHKNGQFVFLPRMAEEKDYWRIAWETNTRKGYFAFLARYPEGEFQEVALKALRVFASGKRPAYSEEARQTFDFLLERLPQQSINYLVNFIQGITTATLTGTTLDMYREWLAFYPQQAIYPLKSFILLGKHTEQQQTKVAAYQALSTKDSAERKAFFQSIEGEKINPYLGLQAYREEDSRFFYGRRAVVKELVDILEHDSVVLISAPASSGKTSLVRAGVFPELQGGRELDLVEIHLKHTPLQELQKAAALFKKAEPAVLFIDGYEGLFMDSVSPDERRGFEDLLGKIHQDFLDKSSRIILCLQSSFELQMKTGSFGRCFWDDRALGFHLYRLPPLAKAELREIVLGPSWNMSYDFESEDLIDFILEEVQKMPNALLLLSFILQKLFNEALKQPEIHQFDQRSVDLATGNISHALNNYFYQVYLSGLSTIDLAEPEEMVARIFMRMLRFAEGKYGARRVYLEELEYPNVIDDQKSKQVLAVLKKAQLIYQEVDGNDKLYVTPLHESVITSWELVRNWTDQFGREKLDLQRELWAAANTDQQGQTSGRAAAYSRYWDNDPRLAQVLDEVLISSTGLLLADTPNALKDALGTIQTGLSGEQAQNFQELISRWKANKVPERLDDFILLGISDQLLSSFLLHGKHWLNKTETDFILESWKKRSADVTKIIRQRDEALKAEEEANISRELAIKEAIEASWKAGGFYGTSIESKDTYIGGVRNIYAKLKWFMNLEKAQSISPIPLFVKAPHKEDFDLNSTSFAYYNPAFLSWVRKHAIPAKGNGLLRKATQGFYDRFLRDLARVYYCAYEHLEQNSDLRDQVKTAYLKFVEEGTVQAGGSFVSGSGGMMLQGALRHYPDQYQGVLASQLGDLAWYHWVVGSGFWIRRHIDTTAGAFREILVDLLETYDSTWLFDLPQLPELSMKKRN